MKTWSLASWARDAPNSYHFCQTPLFFSLFSFFLFFYSKTSFIAARTCHSACIVMCVGQWGIIGERVPRPQKTHTQQKETFCFPLSTNQKFETTLNNLTGSKENQRVVIYVVYPVRSLRSSYQRQTWDRPEAQAGYVRGGNSMFMFTYLTRQERDKKKHNNETTCDTLKSGKNSVLANSG